MGFDTERMLAWVQVLMVEFGPTPRLERLEAYLLRRFNRCGPTPQPTSQ